MNYLSDDEFMTIQDNVRLLSIKGVDDISHYLFDSGIEEYNDFFKILGIILVSISIWVIYSDYRVNVEKEDGGIDG